MLHTFIGLCNRYSLVQFGGLLQYETQLLADTAEVTF